MQPSAIVLHGPTSSGKSSLAKALQANADIPAFHVSLDAFVTMANRGDMRSDEEREQAYRVHCENLRATLARVVNTRFEVILDLVLRDAAELNSCLRVLAPRPTYLVGVWAPITVLEARERAREDRGVGMAREQFEDPAYKRTYDTVIDTSACTPAEGAAAIRRLMAERRLTGQRSGSLGVAAPRPRASSNLVQENERVIITEWRLKPSAETGWHRHEHDYVVVCLTAGRLLAETANGNVETELRFGQSYARPAGVEHNIVNPNAQDFVFVEIELK